MKRYALTLSACLLILAIPAYADTLHLRSGMKIRGRVLSDTDGIIVVKVQHGVLRVPAGQVLSIDRDDEKTNLTDEALALARSGRNDEALARAASAARAGISREQAAELRFKVMKIGASQLEGRLRLAEAHALLLRALELNPADDDILGALKRVDRRLARARGYIEEARQAVARGEFGAAAKLYEKVIRAAPESRPVVAEQYADVCESLGDAALRESDAEAIQWYDTVMALEPERTEGLRHRYVRARLLPVMDLLRRDLTDAALLAMSPIVDFAPGDIQVRYLNGRIHEAGGNRRKARVEYLAALGPDSRPGEDGEIGALRDAVVAKLKEYQKAAQDRRHTRESRASVEGGPAKRMVARHFVVHHRNTPLAREVLDVAAHQAERISSRFGSDTIPWTAPCSIYMLTDETSFLKATGQPVWSGGVSHTESIGGKLTSQYLTIYQTSPKLLSSTVPHEVAHLVFSAFTEYARDVPVALHEGFAVCQEPGQRMAHDRGLLIWRKLSGSLIPLRRLLSAEAVIEPPELFYAQSASVVSYLLSHSGGARRFLSFAKEFGQLGAGAALRKHYEFNSVDEFEAAWLSSLLQ